MSPGKLLEGSPTAQPYAPPSRHPEEAAEVAVDAQQVTEEGYREGFASGQREALHQVSQAHSEFQQKVAQSLSQLDVLADGVVAECQEQILALAAMIAAKVLRREVNDVQEIACDSARAIFEEFRIESDCTVSVHPDDEAAISAIRSELSSRAVITLHADSSLEPGDVRVDTGSESIDATLSAVSRQIVEALRGAR